MARGARSGPARVRSLVTKVRKAKRDLAAARVELAKLTVPAGPAVLVDRGWSRLIADMRRRAARLKARPGVVGVGIGVAPMRTTRRGTPCLTIYVRGRRSTPARRGFPSSINVRGTRVLLDVRPAGTLEPQAFVGQSLSTTIDGITRTGTIGARAIDAQGHAVIVTAMHVTGLKSFPARGVGAVSVSIPSRSEMTRAAAAGDLVIGSTNGIDAALFTIRSSVIDVIPEIGRVMGWRPLLVPGDVGTKVRMFGAVSRRLMDGVIEQPFVELPGLNLEAGIVVRGFDSVGGDSGAALVDSENLVLGFLVGRIADERRVFCPAGLVLRRLGCDIPTVA